ncbi:myosin-K heavy chain-like [Acanthochromis polyacanthus]|uniref:myosin-K heavy chain-like n=1 Tax=Acanthochromis polyacanthus TaxID=80966 RepID=UPI0022340BBC|nr:myosin-K heavy chain-like [Acanthochromis polyacanthus]
MTNFSLSSSLNFLTSESETAAHQEPPAKWSCTPSGFQRGGEEPSRPEEHAAQPERSTSPQPSTSGSLHYPPEPHISLIPPPTRGAPAPRGPTLLSKRGRPGKSPPRGRCSEGADATSGPADGRS